MSARRCTWGAGAIAALGLAACGGGGGGGASSTSSSGASSAGGGERLSLTAGPGSRLFDKNALKAKGGKVTIVMANPSDLSHSVAIEGNGVSAAGEVVSPGGTSIASASLKPGTYTFFCTVPGRRQASMQGTLTVK